MRLKKMFGALVLVVSFAVISLIPTQNALAAPVDLNKYTCTQFNALGEQIQPYMIFWFHGYTTALQEEEVFDDARIEKFATAMVSFCKTNATAEISDALIKAAEASK